MSMLKPNKAKIRSKIMASIRGKDTSPELVVRTYLHGVGLRYRVHTALDGIHPDLVFPKYNAIVFVHGCFWHQHRRCGKAGVPRVRRNFWKDKFKANIKRDARQKSYLLRVGWRVATVWECNLAESVRNKSLKMLYKWIQSKRRVIEIG